MSSRTPDEDADPTDATGTVVVDRDELRDVVREEVREELDRREHERDRRHAGVALAVGCAGLGLGAFLLAGLVGPGTVPLVGVGATLFVVAGLTLTLDRD